MNSISQLRERLFEGLVIPAHPLALTPGLQLDERHQRALTRYYLAAGAGGIAVGVHTTQFEIHRSSVGLYRPVLELAAEEVVRAEASGCRDRVKVAGVVGATDQALAEARLARDLGYHCALLALGSLRDASEDELMEHAGAVAEVIPLFGFYLQAAAGGRPLSFSFWKRFVEIENVVAIKIAPFNRYQTLEVVRAVAESGRAAEIALYTGNDDHILLDLLTPFVFTLEGQRECLRMVGGLLGQWAVWTRRAVECLEQVGAVVSGGHPIAPGLIRLSSEITDANAAIFDARHRFSGCIPGILEILRRQGLVRGVHCLNPEERLSPGQLEEMDRVRLLYPHLQDEEFVREHLEDWLS
ncbi:MAG: dihydrodipicolinate synthase family protein [Acidobacteriota bacterium]